MSNEQMREAFEAWGNPKGYFFSDINTNRATLIAWHTFYDGWQAAQQPQASEVAVAKALLREMKIQNLIYGQFGVTIDDICDIKQLARAAIATLSQGSQAKDGGE